MKTDSVLSLGMLGAGLLYLLMTPLLTAADDATDLLETPEGLRIPGTLLWEAPDRLRFQSAEDQQVRSLNTGQRIRFGRPDAGDRAEAVPPPFQAVLGWDQKISGRLIGLDRDRLELEIHPQAAPLKIDRTGLRQLLQTPGEAQALQDSLEQQATNRWATRGDFSTVATPAYRGKGSFRLGASGAAAELRLPTAISTGRLELAFQISEMKHENVQAAVVLGFLGNDAANENEPIRVGIGWNSEIYSVESPRGPALVLQRLLRTAGWHRLTVNFAPGVTSLAIDGNLLARGRGPRGPLNQILLETRASRLGNPPADLACWFDELRVVQYAEASGEFEVDPSQDEARLITGDQLFGTITGANPDRVEFQIGPDKLGLGWSEVSGLRFQTRSPSVGRPIEGFLVEVALENGSGGDSRTDRVEGVLTRLDSNQIELETPYTSNLVLPRARVTELVVRGPAWRMVIDNASRHLGNERRDDFDPPQPEGTRRDWEFPLPTKPSGHPALVFDVLEVAGMASHLKFADRVRAGLRSNVLINGKLVDNINRYVLTNNEAPERVRIPLPADALRIGRNTVAVELVGTEADPMDLDDLVVLGVALEFTTGPPSQPVEPKPKP